MSAALVSYSQTLAVINEEKCIGCTLCIKACPFDAILGASKQMHTVIDPFCTGCKLCIAPCPMDCISMQDNPRFNDATANSPNFNSHTPCTSCNQCQPVCPNHINPEVLYQLIKNQKFHQAEKQSVQDCTQCGECDKVCPSNIPLSQTFSFAKKMLDFKSSKKLFSQTCKQRLQERENRLANKKNDQLSVLSNNKQQLADKLQALKLAANKNPPSE